MRSRTAPLPASLLLLLLLGGGCASAPATVSWDQLADDLARRDVVFLGEVHDNSVGHLQQLEILRLLHQRRPELVLSMEMFERDVQPALDAYFAGQIDEAAMRERTRPWPDYTRHYRPLVEFCKERGLRVVAANVPRELAREVTKGGVDVARGKEHAAKSTSAPRDAYWKAFQSAMQGHGGVDEDSVYRFYQAQCLKDDTMAEAIVAARAPAAGARPPLVVHVTGGFHAADRLGTVARVLEREPGLQLAVVGMRVEPSVEVVGGGDYELVVPSEPPAPPKPKSAPKTGPEAAPSAQQPEDPAEQGGRPGLGIQPNYDAAVEGVEVGFVSAGGAAENAGILPGDVIVRVGGEDVADVHEYTATLDGLRVGATIDVVVIRDGERKTVPVKVGVRRH